MRSLVRHTSKDLDEVRPSWRQQLRYAREVCVPTHFYDRVSPSAIAMPIDTQKRKAQSIIKPMDYLERYKWFIHYVLWLDR